MTPRNRIDFLGGSSLIGLSLAFDGIKALPYFLPLIGEFIGPFFNWVVVAPISYIAISTSLHLWYNVGWGERVGWRVGAYIVFGPVPLSTTVGTTAIIVGTVADDWKYNKGQTEGI
jgi:hypothetical protein